jgi:hypothetical protein
VDQILTALRSLLIDHLAANQPLSSNVASVVHEMILGPTGEPAPRETWFHTTFLIHLEPNPAHEIAGRLSVSPMCAP